MPSLSRSLQVHSICADAQSLQSEAHGGKTFRVALEQEAQVVLLHLTGQLGLSSTQVCLSTPAPSIEAKVLLLLLLASQDCTAMQDGVLAVSHRSWRPKSGRLLEPELRKRFLCQSAHSVSCTGLLLPSCPCNDYKTHTLPMTWADS